jgi:LuxR family transcriptional regulator, maltose regulon positive regulatory protein
MAQIKLPPLLKAKLQPPGLGRTILKRRRLIDRLVSFLDLKATVLVADAGYGKTTLVSDFIAESNLPSVWYQLDQGDNDLLIFLRYLIYGLRQHYPEFGEISLELLQAGTSRSIKPEQLIDAWLNEASEQVENKTIIVLDDFHVLDGNQAISSMVGRLLLYLPDTLHVIITSRTYPELNLARLRSKQAIYKIDRSDLAFNENETLLLFNEIYNYEIPPEQAREYWTTADGWITALQLMCQVAGQRGQATLQSLELDRSFQNQSLFEIFGYFAEDVFGLESPDIQRYLSELSLLNWIKPDICREVLGIKQPLEWLDDLVRRNVFITRRGEPGSETYSLHPLFRAFLNRWLAARFEQDEIAALHRRYAVYAASHGQLNEALYHSQEGRDSDMVLNLLTAHGLELVSQGAFEQYKKGFEHVTAEAVLDRPILLNYLAEIHWREGNYARARSLFTDAINLAERIGNVAVCAFALHGMAEIAYRQGDLSLSRSLAASALQSAPEQDCLLRARCHNVMGLCSWAEGAFDAAIGEWRKARDDARADGNNHFAAIIAHNLGLPYSLMGLWEQAVESFESLFADAAKPFPQQAIAYLNIARILLLRGEFARASNQLEHALEICRLFNLQALRGEVLETIGNLHRDQGDYVKAEEFYRDAERVYGEVGLNIEDKELLDERAAMYLMRGQLELALETINRLYNVREATGNELALAGVQLSRARIYLARGEIERALADLVPARSVFENFRMFYHQAGVSALFAQAYFAAGNELEARKELRRLLQLVEEYGYSYWLQHQARLTPALLELVDDSSGIVMVEPQQSERQKVSPSGSEHEQPYDLVVRLFGPVQIYCNEQQRPQKYAWSLKQALSIFCYIAANRNHRASKEMLIDLFWQDASASAIAKNFHPTISYIRKALNSGLIHKRNFLIFANDAYQLNPEYRYFIDTDRFNESLAAAARTENDPDIWEGHLKEAINLYRGDLLADFYDEWIEPERAVYLNQYLKALAELGNYEMERGRWGEAEEFYQKILSRDNFREEIHCNLMKLYKIMGNRAAIKQQYDSLRRLLKTELHVEPLDATTQLYNNLIKN